MGERSDEGELRRLDVLFIDPAIVDEVLHAMQGNSSSVSIRLQLPEATSASALERKPSSTATPTNDDVGDSAAAAAAANTERVFHATQADSRPHDSGPRHAAKRAHRLSLAPPIPVEAVTFQTRQRQQRSSLDAVLRRASIYWLTGRAPRLSSSGGGGGGATSSIRVEINVSRTHAQLKPIASPSHMLRLRYIGNGQVQWSLVQRHLFQSRAMPPSFARFAERHDAMRPQAATRTAKQKDRERKKQVAMAAATAARVAATGEDGEKKKKKSAAAAAADPAKKKTKRPAVPKTQQLLTELSQNAASYEVAINRIGAADETFVYATPRPTDAFVRERGVCLVLSTADFFEQCREMAVLGNGRFVCAADPSFVWLSARGPSGQIAFRFEKAPDPPPPVDSHPNVRARQRAKGIIVAAVGATARAAKGGDGAASEDDDDGQDSDWGYERESDEDDDEDAKEEEATAAAADGDDRDSGDDRGKTESDGTADRKGGDTGGGGGGASRKRKKPAAAAAPASGRKRKKMRAPQKPAGARRGSRSAAAQAAEDEPRVVRLPRPGAPPVGHWFALQHVFFAISHLSTTKIKSLRLYLVPDVGLLLHMRSPGAARGTGVDYYANFLPTAPPAADLGRRPPSVRRLLLTAADERLPDECRAESEGGDDTGRDDDTAAAERRPNADAGVRSRLARDGGDGRESDGHRDSGGGGGGSRPRCDVDSVYAHLWLWSDEKAGRLSAISSASSSSSSSSPPSSSMLSPPSSSSSLSSPLSDVATRNRPELAHASVPPDSSTSRALATSTSSFRVPLSVLLASASASSSSASLDANTAVADVPRVETPQSTSLAASLFPVNERAWVPLSCLPVTRRR